MKHHMFSGLVLAVALGGVGCATPRAANEMSPRRAANTVAAIEEAAAESRAYEARMQAQIRELREDLYRTALTMKDFKMRIDELAAGLTAHSAAVTNLLLASAQARSALEASEAAQRETAAAEDEREQLRRQLAAEQARARREREIAEEKDRQIADLRAALEARDAKAAAERERDEAKSKRKKKAVNKEETAPEVIMPPPAEAAPEPVVNKETPASRAPAEPLDDKALAKLVADANRFLARGDLRAAHERFSRALESNPEMNGARVGLAACLYMMDELDRARDLVNDVVAEGASMVPEALGLRGIINWKQGRLDDAEFDCREAVERSPDDAQLRNYLGIVLHARRQTADAIVQFRRSVELNPENAEALLNLAILLATGPAPDLAEARMRYQQALALGTERDPQLDKLLGVAGEAR